MSTCKIMFQVNNKNIVQDLLKVCSYNYTILLFWRNPTIFSSVINIWKYFCWLGTN